MYYLTVVGKKEPKKAASYDDLLASFKRYRIVVFIMIVLFIGQNLLELLELPSRFLSLPALYSSETTTRLRDNEGKLKQLKNGVSINFVESLFGKAKFVNDMRAPCGPNAVAHPSSCNNEYMQKEYIFQFPDFILIAVTDKDSNLVMYSITTLNSDFKPSLPVFFSRFTDFYEVQLGVTTFAELPTEDRDSYVYVEREGFMSGNGGNGGFNKIYRSEDYAAFDNYVFQTSYDARALTGFMNEECPTHKMDTMFSNFTDDEMEKNFDDVEKECVISTIKYVSQHWTENEIDNGPEFYANFVEIWY